MLKRVAVGRTLQPCHDGTENGCAPQAVQADRHALAHACDPATDQNGDRLVVGIGAAGRDLFDPDPRDAVATLLAGKIMALVRERSSDTSGPRRPRATVVLPPPAVSRRSRTSPSVSRRMFSAASHAGTRAAWPRLLWRRTTPMPGSMNLVVNADFGRLDCPGRKATLWSPESVCTSTRTGAACRPASNVRRAQSPAAESSRTRARGRRSATASPTARPSIDITSIPARSNVRDPLDGAHYVPVDGCSTSFARGMSAAQSRW